MKEPQPYIGDLEECRKEHRCGKKRRFMKKEHAEIAAKIAPPRKGIVETAYLCNYCGLWHFGGMLDYTHTGRNNPRPNQKEL